jgi:chorismate mutase
MASATFELRAVDKTAKAFSSVQAQLEKMHGAVKGVSRNLGSLFGLGAAISAARRLNAVMHETEKNADAIGLSTEEANKLTVATGMIDRGFQAVSTTVSNIVSGIAGMVSKGEKLDPAIEAARIRFERAKPVLNELNQKLADQIVANELIYGTEEDILNALENEVQRLEMKVRLGKDIVQRANDEIALEVARGKVIEHNKKIVEDDRKLYAEQLDLRKQINAAIGIEPDIQQELNDKLDARLSLTQSIRQLERESPDATGEANAMRQQRNQIDKDLIPLLNERYKLEKQIGEAVGDSFQTAIFEGGKFMDVLKGLILQVIKLIFYQNVTRRIASFVSTSLIGNPLATVETGIAQVGGPFALGGTVQRKKPIIVGERGAELFVPSSSGTIVPNHRMGTEGGSAPAINITYNIASGISRAELAPILDTERKRLKAEIPDMVRRGGAYRAAFA